MPIVIFYFISKSTRDITLYNSEEKSDFWTVYWYITAVKVLLLSVENGSHK